MLHAPVWMPSTMPHACEPTFVQVWPTCAGSSRFVSLVHKSTAYSMTRVVVRARSVGAKALQGSRHAPRWHTSVAAHPRGVSTGS